jgi:hypothetical protein
VGAAVPGDDFDFRQWEVEQRPLSRRGCLVGEVERERESGERGG